MPGREDIFQKAMNDGHSAAWDQEWDKAVTAYRQRLAGITRSSKGAQQPRACALSTRQFEEALQIYMNVAKISPDDPVPMEKVAQLSERTRRPEDRSGCGHARRRPLPQAA